MLNTREQLFEHFDEDVLQHIKIQTVASLDRYEQMLLALTLAIDLGEEADLKVLATFIVFDADMEEFGVNPWGTIPIDEIVSAQPMTRDPTFTINGEKHKPVFTYHNVGDEWPRKCERTFSDPYVHEGMVYNEYTKTWSWF